MPDAYTVTLTPGALADLDRLDSFIREKSPAAANRMLSGIAQALTRLAENPFDSPVPSSSRLRARVVRFGRGGYICLYHVGEKEVVVARLFNTREDWFSSTERKAE